MRRLLPLSALRLFVVAVVGLTGCPSNPLPGTSDLAAAHDADIPDLALSLADAAGFDDIAMPPPRDATVPRDLAVSCPGVFPSFERQCSADADCVAVLHQIDCCGTYVALGIRVTEQTAFAAAEKDCEAMYPGCGCASRPTVADDGTQDQGGSRLSARCSAGRCLSHFGP